MIKIQDNPDTLKYCCLNPFCSDKSSRRFASNHHHLNLQNCRKWIVPEQQMKMQYNQLTNKDFNNISIDFINQPIKTFQILLKLNETDWQKYLNQEQTKVKREVSKAIEKEFSIIRQKLQQIINCGNLYSSMIDIFKSHEADVSDMINTYLENESKRIDQLRSSVLFKRVDMKLTIEKIKSEIATIHGSIINQENKIVNRMFSNQEQRAFYDFIFEKTDNQYNKLQLLASCFATQPKPFNIINQQLNLQCILCQRRSHIKITPENKKYQKKYLSNQILSHIYSNHYEQACFKFVRKIEKLGIKPIYLDEAFQQSEYFQIVQIVDRSSGVIYQQKYDPTKQSCYTIEILSIKNSNMAQGKYIGLEKNQSIDYLIGILAYLCYQRQQKVEILTNKSTLRDGLMHLMQKDRIGQIKKENDEFK